MTNHEPYFMAGGPTGCLLIHGFSGSPAETRGLAERLAADGHTVAGVRLARHTMSPADLAGARWHEWLASAEDGFAQLQNRCSEVFVCGFSLGGALAVLLALRRRVQRLVLLAMPSHLSDDWRASFLPLARFVMPWFYLLAQADFSDPFVRQKTLENAPHLNLDDPQVQQWLRTEVRLPMAAIHEAAQAINQARASLPRVNVPTLVMQGRNDETVPPGSADTIFRRLGTRHKELVWWEQTGHQLLVVGPYRQHIYDRVADFLRTTSY